MTEQHTYTAEYFDIQVQFARKWAILANLTAASEIRKTLENKTALKRVFSYKDMNDQKLLLWSSITEDSRQLLDNPAFFSTLLYTNYLNTLADQESVSNKSADNSCVRVEYDSSEKVLHTHFVPVTINGSSALSRLNRPERFRQYQSLFSSLSTRFAPEITVIGNSWLYNIESYNWLFPANKGYFNGNGQSLARKTSSSAIGQRIFPVEDVRNNPHNPLPNLKSWTVWGQFLDKDLKTKSKYAIPFLSHVNEATTLEDLFDSFPNPVRFYFATLQAWLINLFERES